MSLSAPDDFPRFVFYTTRIFHFGQQIRITQSADGFLGGGIGGMSMSKALFGAALVQLGMGHARHLGKI